jgi:hypothetical protein
MNLTIVVVCLGTIAILALVYIVRLLVREGGDFEAGGRAGTSQFFVKAKERRR